MHSSSTPAETELLRELEQLRELHPSFDATAHAVVASLRDKNAPVSWVGIYEARFDGRLRLGPFCGPPTDHVFVPPGRGVCGTAIREQRLVYAPDVSRFQGYLRGFADTRSELAVPIMNPDQVFGLINLHGDRVDAFPGPVQGQLERVAQWLADLFERRDLDSLDACPRLLSA